MLSANQIAGFFKMLYLKKEVKDEVYFCHADKHQSFLQVDAIVLGVRGQACPMNPKQKVCMSLQYLRKNVEDDFLPIDKHEIFLQGDSIILGMRSQACSNYPK